MEASLSDKPGLAGKPFQSFVDVSFASVSQASSPFKHVSSPLGERELEAVMKTGDRKKMKQFLRTNHWPADHQVRGSLWMDICRLLTTDQGSIYSEMVKMVFGEGEHSAPVSLPSFVDPANMVHYHLNEHGVHVAKRIVCVIGNTNPDITFAPAIFSMVCLFLHYTGEEECYNCIYGLLRGSQGYLIQTKLAHEASKFVLKDLSKKYARASYNHISKQGLVVEGVFENWHDWILNDLPFQYMVRVIDCYLYEGPKVFYRVALAILILFQKQLGTKKTGLGIAAAIKQYCEDIPVSIDKLLKTAFGIRGLSRKELKKSMVKSEMYVKSMRHVASLPHMTKSASCESLNLKVSRSFSGPMALQTGSKLLQSDQTDGQPNARGRSQSHGVLPFASVSSSLVTFTDWQTIWSWLPTRITLFQPRLLYTTAEHGTSLKMFYSCVDGYEPTLLVLKNDRDEIAGAYCSTDWSTRHSLKKFGYFGSGESFLFSLSRKKQRYEWVGNELKDKTPNHAHMFMAGNDQKISIGGGVGEGLQLDNNLLHGRSETCATFNNAPLFDNKDFMCVTLEVFGFH